ncbi:MAG: hypothetical protein WAW37_14045 [Syntrophobacteraceae bacterium]
MSTDLQLAAGIQAWIAYAAACLLRSCGSGSIPAGLPAFFTTNLHAA